MDEESDPCASCGRDNVCGHGYGDACGCVCLLCFKEETWYEKCDNCKEKIDCWKCNIYILNKDDDDICLCLECFDYNKDFYKEDNWSCDDFSNDDDV